MALTPDTKSQLLEPAAQRLVQEFKKMYYGWCAEQARVPRKPEGSEEGPSHPDDGALEREMSFSNRFPKDPSDPRDFKLIPVMLE
ncbi:hypothetical protein FIE12Z_11483 [Fusarium flagelliforme]|uniref:Uncharacterized protein n=2 Tax=Fusarium flagelliforme TaxID=2675880 RepID=A0A395M8X4_9HYPO|nr:hypothetical protein FIE12Z_11483 [Fusarium flagelliforme]